MPTAFRLRVAHLRHPIASHESNPRQSELTAGCLCLFCRTTATEAGDAFWFLKLWKIYALSPARLCLWFQIFHGLTCSASPQVTSLQEAGRQITAAWGHTAGLTCLPLGPQLSPGNHSPKSIMALQSWAKSIVIVCARYCILLTTTSS